MISVFNVFTLISFIIDTIGPIRTPETELSLQLFYYYQLFLAILSLLTADADADAGSAILKFKS